MVFLLVIVDQWGHNLKAKYWALLLNPNCKSSFTLQLVICGAFYPNYFTSSDIDEAEVMKAMSGHDPCTTVMVCTWCSSEQ